MARAASSSARPRPGCGGSTTVSSAISPADCRNLTTDLRRGPDGIVHFINLQLYSPKLRLSGSGQRNRDGTFHIVASGRQSKYGPLKLTLDGRIERPRIDLLLASPNQALGITNMRLLLDPIAAGFNYRASGGSKLGPFTSNGQILLPKGQPTVIAIAALDAGGAHASGRLRSDPGGFCGQLHLTGGTLQGTLGFVPVNGAQRIDAHLTANGASFPAFAVRSGRIDGSIILDQAITHDRRSGQRQGRRGRRPVARHLSANAKLVDGSGQVRAAFAGRRGAAFSFTTLANVSPDRISLTGNGRIERTPLVLEIARGLDPQRRRLGAGADRSDLRRRLGDRVGPKRLGARGSRRRPRDAVGRARLVLAQARPQRDRHRQARLCVDRAIARAGSTSRSRA